MNTKKLFAAAACLLLSGMAQAGVKIEHWTTPTGARVYFVATDAIPILDIKLDIPAGGTQVPAGKAGLASLTYGLLDAGAGDMNEDAIAERVVDLGIQMGGSADSDRTGITLRTLTDPAQRNGALSLLKTLLSSPTFPADVLAREKARTIAAIQEADTRPGTVLAKNFSAATYPGHPYGRSASVETVASITRDDIVAFYKRNYTSNGAVISMIGAISRAEAEAIAADLAAALPSREALPATPPVVLPQAQTLRITHPSAQTHIAIGMPSVKRSDPEYYALLVGNYSLGGGGFVSRLMKEVREKRGYAYDVHSYFAPQLLEGPFQIGLQTRSEQADAALKVVDSVLDEYLKTGPSEAELKAAKQYIVDGLALRIDSNAKLLSYLSAIGFYGLPLNYLDDYPRLINSITAEQVRAAFKSHVSRDKLVTVIVGAGKDTSVSP
ncbi:MAG TPA: pitrilysin family protein [Rhodocyclaceae bacterium]|nr:pitrilysin family protein [Rhodocyclaceae bacterium]